MKQTGDLDNIEREMRPGAISREGFLGRDPRRLIDILDADGAAVRRLGLTHERIADRMRALSDAGRRGLGEPIRVEPHFEVRVDGVRGKLPCPFHGGIFPKINTTVRNLDLGREITFTDLNTHMVREHGFYEGEGSPFRVAPRDLAEILEIEAEDQAPTA